ncbi:ferric-chelate reductase 1-like [Haemaphysalis longicornis]
MKNRADGVCTTLACGPVALLLVTLLSQWSAQAFPQGGPAESCDSMLPRHVYTAPKPAHESPYTFVASANRYSYQNVDGIQVELGGAPFKGFFIAAMDPRTQKRIGSFLKVKGTHPVTCSAVTHNDAHPKSHVSLLWLPPQNTPEGEVVFMATVVESYSRYFTGLVAAVPAVPTLQYIKKK